MLKSYGLFYKGTITRGTIVQLVRDTPSQVIAPDFYWSYYEILQLTKKNCYLAEMNNKYYVGLRNTSIFWFIKSRNKCLDLIFQCLDDIKIIVEKWKQGMKEVFFNWRSGKRVSGIIFKKFPYNTGTSVRCTRYSLGNFNLIWSAYRLVC